MVLNNSGQIPQTLTNVHVKRRVFQENKKSIHGTERNGQAAIWGHCAVPHARLG